MPAQRRQCRGPKLVAGSTPPPDVSPALEYLDEAIEEAEAAARWYAARSTTAASGFADEIDAAIAAIEQNPEAWPSYDHGTRHHAASIPIQRRVSHRGHENSGGCRGAW